MLRDGLYWTPGDYASGAAADYTDAVATQLVGWYTDNSGGSTHLVGAKPAGGNTLGLFDLSGNVWECSFTPDNSNRMRLGGYWSNDARNLQVGNSVSSNPANSSPAKTAHCALFQP